MLPQSPCKCVSSPQKAQQHLNHQWRPSPSRRRGRKVAGALPVDWNEEQVKSSSVQGSTTVKHRHASSVQGGAPRATRPLTYHEWKQQKQQAVAATTGSLVAGGMAAAVGSAEATTGLPQEIPVLEPIVLAPQAPSPPASATLLAESISPPSGLLQRVPKASSPEGNTQEGRVLSDMTDLVLDNPEAAAGAQASQDAVTHQVATSAPANTVRLLSTTHNSPIDASSSSGLQSSWSSVSSAGNAPSDAVAAASGAAQGGLGVEQGQGQESMRRSVLGPLENAVGAAVNDAWQGATERLAAAIDEQLPGLDGVPGGEQLQGMLEGIKQLGSQLSSQMLSSWPTSPTLTKVLAYLAASLGLLFLIPRAPSPKPTPQQQQQKTKPGPPAMITPPRSKASAHADIGSVQGGVGKEKIEGGGKRGLWDEAGALGGILAAIVGEWQQSVQPKGRFQNNSGEASGGSSDSSADGTSGLSSTSASIGRASGSSSVSDSGANATDRANSASGFSSGSTATGRASSNEFGRASGSNGGVGDSMASRGVTAAGVASTSAWAAPKSEGVSGSGCVEGSKNEGWRLQDQERARTHLKRLLHETNKSLGPVASIMPVGQYEPLRREMDALMQQLEKASGHGRSGSNPQGGNSRGNGTSNSSSMSSPQAPEWSGSGLGVAQWDTWERKTGPNEWDSRTPASLKPPPSDPRMLGAWELSYVSLTDLQLEEEEGGWLPPPTSMMAFVMQVMIALPGFGIDQVVQHLWEDPSVKGSLAMASTATFRLGPLGSLRLCARGGWRERRRHGEQQGSHAVAWFETLGVQPLSLLGFEPEEGILPEVVVTLPSDLQQPTEFLTTYLDADSRITRGASGAYLFRKLPPASKGALLAPV